MSARELAYGPDLDHLRRLAGHVQPDRALALVADADPTELARTVPLLLAAADALRDDLSVAWADGADESEAVRRLTDGQWLAAAWTAAATAAATRSDDPHVPALARAALLPCLLAAWAGGEPAATALTAARRLVERHPTAVLRPALAHLAAADPAAAGAAQTSDTLTAYGLWVEAPDTATAAADLHLHVPALLDAATAGDEAQFETLAARRLRHHQARATRRRRDPSSVLDLLAIVAATTAHRHGLTPEARPPQAPTLLPGLTP